MGVIKRGILGGMSGKVANVVGGSWKGIAYLRSLPLSVANPQTTAQTNQRTRFSTLVAIAQLILADFIKPVTDRFVQGMSGFNAFISRNVPYVSGAGVVTYSSLKMAVGNLHPSAITLSQADDSGNVYNLEWDNADEGSNGLSTDIAYGVFYNATTDLWFVSAGTDTRTDGSLSVSGAVAVGNTVHSWLVFVAANGSRVSNSVYSICTVVA